MTEFLYPIPFAIEPEPPCWDRIETAPINQSVLVRHRESVGDTFDVAVFVGRHPDGELRWIMGDVRLVSRQLTHWHPLPEAPASE